MKTRFYALGLGVAFLVAGILGFIPAFLTPPMNMPLRIEAGHGLLFGYFPVNVLHNAVHLVFGVWGVVVWRSFMASRGYARTVAIVYGVVTIMGLIPVLSTVFGMMPVYGYDVWLHGLIAVVSAYFGYASITAVEGTDIPRH